MERSKTAIAAVLAVVTTAAYGLYRRRTAADTDQSAEPAPQAD
ncbi:MAG: hypothetical protein ABEH61_00725 [Haloarculaceae archaeon]